METVCSSVQQSITKLHYIVEFTFEQNYFNSHIIVDVRTFGFHLVG